MIIRVIKMAIAALLAVYAAEWAGLASAPSAGLLAVIGVDATKRRSLKGAAARLLASVLSLCFASLLFIVCGFHIWVIAAFVLVVYPLLVKAKLQDGVVSALVVMLHLYVAQRTDYDMLAGELSLLLLGLGIATVVNMLYTPNADRKLLVLRKQTERLFGHIFYEIGGYLKNKDHPLWDGQEVLQAEETIRKGTELARHNEENALFRPEHDWAVYFAMRKLQFESIERMLELSAQVTETLPQGAAVAELFELLNEDVRSDYYTGNAETKLAELEHAFKTMPLPAARAEFEVRSALLQLCIELRNYLSIAKRRKKRKA
ncbi:aromatic acid exporter family protein [Paenibacillus cymbidii]|uniref:aromatic acid exporter family protein n=1 Tax=Paenibacillus cymbidii TaxID=1639034 RepID=UPI001080FF9F|nr:aromatic acid exporter family protein [Paenibacillus cymbidii]